MLEKENEEKEIIEDEDKENDLENEKEELIKDEIKNDDNNESII